MDNLPLIKIFATLMYMSFVERLRQNNNGVESKIYFAALLAAIDGKDILAAAQDRRFWGEEIGENDALAQHALNTVKTALICGG